jgi:tetratricopeptide (TPR) repeat protein
MRQQRQNLHLRCLCSIAGRAKLCLGLFLVGTVLLRPPQTLCQAEAWQQAIRTEITQGHFDTALEMIEHRLAEHSDDLEARGWRARILSWEGHWAEAEDDYRSILQQAPEDIDVLCGLADVLLWQWKLAPALAVIDRAQAQSPRNEQVLLSRARILRALGRAKESREQFREVLRLNPHDPDAISGLRSVSDEYRHELRFGTDIDTFNYADPAQEQVLTLNSQWNRRWSTTLTSGFVQRFGSTAERFGFGSTYRFSDSDWITARSGGQQRHHRSQR